MKVTAKFIFSNALGLCKFISVYRPKMEKKHKWGILGSGLIAADFVKSLSLVAGTLILLHQERIIIAPKCNLYL